MANEALESLQRTLNQILQRDDDLTTRCVKLNIICIHDKAVVLQLNLKHFLEEEEETFMEVANTAAGIIHYLFSPANLSDRGSTEAAAVMLSGQLQELAAEVESTVGDVVDYISSSTSDGDRLKLPMESAAQISKRFRRLLEKIKSTVSDEEDPSSTELAAVAGNSSLTSALMTQDDVMAGLDQYVNVPASDGSSSPPSAPSTKDVVGFEDDLFHILDQLVSSSTRQRVLSIVGMAGIGKSTLAKIVYESGMIKYRFDIRAWVTISQDSTRESVVSNLLASLKGKTEQFPTGLEAERFQSNFEEIFELLYGTRYLIVMDGLWTSNLWDDTSLLLPDNCNGSRIILTTRLMDLAENSCSSIHKMQFLDEKRSWDLFQRRVFGDRTCPLELQPVAKKIVKGCDGLPLSIVTKASLLSMFDKTPKIWQQIGANDAQLATISSSSYNDLPQRLKPCFLYMAAFPGDYEIHASEITKLWIAESFLECSDESKSLEQVAEAYLEDLVVKNLVLVTSKKIDGSIQKCKLHSTVRDFCVRQAERVKLLLPVMDYLPTPILRRHFLPQLLENYRCISASWYDLDLKESMHSSCTKTIICIPQKGYKPKLASVRTFGSLRVLHVLRRNDGSYWELGQVFDLIHLTYLASNIPTSLVPPAISNLQNLQTLIIYRHEVHLPVEIWRLRRLRHLIAFSFHPLPHPEEEAFPLLEKLKLERHSLIWPSLNPHFPQSLKKLTLSGWRLPWSDMVIVASLARLQVLKLRNYACYGECWETREGGFLRLKLLLIDESNLQHWIAESNHFPVLQCLVLHRCASLHEIPDDIGDIPTLELIEIDDSNESLLYSAKRIQEEQIEWGNDDLQVHAVRL